jgi:hypothetical protein
MVALSTRLASGSKAIWYAQFSIVRYRKVSSELDLIHLLLAMVPTARPNVAESVALIAIQAVESVVDV